MKGKKKNIKLSTMQILALGFFGVILAGGVLLWLPVCNTKPITFVDALFTSTTSVCVTGLVTVTAATQFTLLGKIIMLILIQIGGLGVIACATAFFMIIRKKITVKERVIIQETYNLDTLSGMVLLIKKILKGTFFVEGIGAILFSFQFVPEYGVIRGMWYAVFHSVSAFCNAGIDILGTDSFMHYAKNPLINLTTMTLIVLGGIGFTVWTDVLHSCSAHRKKKMPGKTWFGRLTLHSKMAISMTIILIVFGTLNFLFMEYSNPDTFGGMNFGQKLMASAFHSVSTRTAGFATVSQGDLHIASKFFSCFLMFIGGSPGGTAGGVKTTTVAMLFLTCISVLKDREDTECFKRKIPMANVRTGFSVVMVAFTFLMTGTMLVAILESNIYFIDILYETTSAIATVGLSAGITSSLCTASKCVIIMLMYIGRIGPVTLALAFGIKGNIKDKIRELPIRRIMVG
ncbi:MAG: potassium transporter TrkG [Lachnospiraceae bacterium]